jgi:carbon storage regulator
MLVLSRKKNESVVLIPSGDVGSARVVVLQITGDKIRLGIESPRDWQVHRSEFHEPPDEGAGMPARI